MDADHSHNPQDISRLLEVATKGYDLVIGSRYCSEGCVKGWPISRSVISKMANRLTHFIINLPLRDFTSGFRCYSRKYIVNALPHLHSQTYEIQIETIRQAKLQKSKVVEIPIENIVAVFIRFLLIHNLYMCIFKQNSTYHLVLKVS
jgi:dolichol-phosphate mannosyltransferase